MSPLPTWPKYVLIIFGIVMVVGAFGLLIWSLFRPPVTSGPMPPDPAPLSPKR